MANLPDQGDIPLISAISMGQDAGCSCRNRGRLLIVHGDCRLGSSTAQRFRAKSLTHADTHRFPDAGLCPYPQSQSYRNPKRSDDDQSEPYSKSNPNSDSHSDPNAPGLTPSECVADTHAASRVPLTFWR